MKEEAQAVWLRCPLLGITYKSKRCAAALKPGEHTCPYSRLTRAFRSAEIEANERKEAAIKQARKSAMERTIENFKC